MDTQSVPKTIVHEEGRKNGVIHKNWYDHGRTSRTASYGPGLRSHSRSRLYSTAFYASEKD